MRIEIHVLRRLGGLATSRLADDDHNIVFLEFRQEFSTRSRSRSRQVTTLLEQVEVSRGSRLPVPRVGSLVLSGQALRQGGLARLAALPQRGERGVGGGEGSALVVNSRHFDAARGKYRGNLIDLRVEEVVWLVSFADFVVGLSSRFSELLRSVMENAIWI